jgi:L-ascorbate metabolism protein UlaG (beta-lactamase superfamily)
MPKTAASLEFLGTATTLLRLGPFTLLTDPNFLHRGQRAYLGRGLFSRRLTEPSMQPTGLPSLDAIVLSHLHGDHFDRVARQQLDHRLPVFTTPPAQRKLSQWGFSAATAMNTWETRELVKDGCRLSITAAPGQHAPGLAQHALPRVMGTVLELGQAGSPPVRIYITGDTLFRPWLRDVVERTGPLDAAVIHLGGTRILGLLVTMDDKQGADLLALLAPRVAVPVHYDDYTVFRSPLQDFLAAMATRALPTDVRVVARGDRTSLVPTPDSE